jgi:hypothetical protein
VIVRGHEDMFCALSNPSYTTKEDVDNFTYKYTNAHGPRIVPTLRYMVSVHTSLVMNNKAGN